MNPKQKAEELFKKYSEVIYPMWIHLPKPIIGHYCMLAVKEIVDAIEVTTGHCQLRRLDVQEVGSDIKFWGQVIKEIEKISLS